MMARLIPVVRALVFIVAALVLCGVIFQFAGYSAFSMFQDIVDGAFLRPGAPLQSLRWALPLFITSVASFFASSARDKSRSAAISWLVDQHS